MSYIYSYLLIVFLFLVISGIVIVYSKSLKQLKSQLLKKESEINKLENQFKKFSQQVDERVLLRTKELEEEVNERNQLDYKLKKALKKAEDANYLKNAFLSNMSHEIRTPLNGIIGFASLLETELSLLENEELYDYANGISQSGERLLHLLNNIIDISRIEANDMEISLKPCNISEIVKGAVELYVFKANEKGLKFNIQTADNPFVIADSSSLAKIISDVIENAIKYTETGFVNISVGYNENENEAYVRIKDTGIGIESAYLPNIFDAFRQESLGYSRAYQGAGLGLPLAKRLIELMRGHIAIDSIKGIGTTVTIFIPASIQESPMKESMPVNISIPSEIIKHDVEIFIVEDDRMNRLVLKKMLENKFKLTLSVDGEETLKIISETYSEGKLFDIMLFDINLPVPWDGILLMKEIKNRWKEYNNIPFIAQTAYAMSGDKERLLEAGFDDYIPKPINQGHLISMINNHLKTVKDF